MGDKEKSPLGEIKLSSNVYEAEIDGKLNLRLEKVGQELISTYRAGSEDPQITRFILGHVPHLYLDPGLPDLPIVIKPEYSISILPGCTLDAYIDVPMVFILSYGTAKNKNVLHEFPVKSLSRSWFGDPVNGEIAYFLESSLENVVANCSTALSCVHCPVTITNKTNQILVFERMILQVPYLSIYRGGGQFYSNKTKIAFRGQDQISQISILKSAPEIDTKLELASPARQAIDSSLLRKSFYFIKTLYEG